MPNTSVRTLSKRTGLAETTVFKALHDDRPLTAAVAALLAGPLRVDICHAMLCVAADQLDDALQHLLAPGRTSSKRGRRRVDTSALAVQAEQLVAARRLLDAAMSWQGSSRYLSANSGRRLAMRAHRRGGDGDVPCSREDVARHLVGRAGERSVRALALELSRYEHDQRVMDDQRLREWLVALSAATGRPITLDDLDARGRALHSMHLPHTTAETHRLHARGRMKVLTPRGGILWLDRTQLVGALNLEILRYESAAEVTRPARVLNARHPGIEIATMLSGTGRLVLTRREVATWSTLADSDIVQDVSLLPGQSAVFPSGYWHHAELGPGASAQSLNLTGNLWLHRRNPPRDGV